MSSNETTGSIVAEAKYKRARKRFLDLWSVIAGLILLAGAVYLLNILSLPMAIVIWTIIFVFSLRGLVNWLEKKGVNRTIGTSIAYVVMFLVFGIIGLLMFSPAFGLNQQLVDLTQSLPGYVQGVIDWGNGIYARYADVFQDETVHNMINEAQKSVTTWASQIASGGANGLMAVGTTIANGLMAIGFALVIAFWILMELPAIGRETSRIIGPKHAEDAAFLHATFTRVMGGYIKGTLLQCTVIGVACGILFAVIGVPNAAVIGLITGIMNIIPVIGPWIGGALAAIVALFTSPIAALIAVVGTVVIQQLVYTFVSPKIMQNSVDIHPALTLFALMVGSALGGAMNGIMGSLVGMLASIPLVAVAKSVFVYYFEKQTGRHIVAEDGVFFKGAPQDGGEVNPMVDATAPGLSGSMSPIKVEEEKVVHKIPILRRFHHGSVGAHDPERAERAGRDGEDDSEKHDG